MKKYFVILLMAAALIISSCGGGGVSSEFSKLDTMKARIGENTSQGAMQFFLDGSDANYTYYFAEDADFKGDLVVGNQIYVVVGTMKEDQTEKRVVAFWNEDNEYSKMLPKLQGMWVHRDTSPTVPVVMVELLPNKKIATSHLPSRLYTQWRIVDSSTLVLEGFAAGGAVAHDTVEVRCGEDSSFLYVKPLALLLEAKK